MVLFSTECIDAADADTGSINYEIISRAEPKYSKERTQDISAEYRFQYPGLMDIFETFRGAIYNLSREDLELRCLDIIMSAHKFPDSRSWLPNIDEQKLINVLWEVGFIRALAVGGQKGMIRSGSRYIGVYQNNTLNLEGISQFHVHPMFRTYLGMKEK